MQVRMSVEMLLRGPDVLFVPAKRLPRIRPKRTLTTIHDLAFHHVRSAYTRAANKRLIRATKTAAKKATSILTPTQFTKTELMKFYGVSEDRIVVTPLAADTELYHELDSTQVATVLDAYRLGSHYILFIGRYEKKKNPLVLVRAFEQYKKSRGTGDPFDLVLIGKPGHGFEELKKYVDASPVKENIKFLGYVDGKEAAAILNGATLYGIPSLYEGFSLTTLEAMACGTPVIASDIPAHREVCADAALFAPAEAPQVWAREIARLIENPEELIQLREKGLDRAQSFSWDRTAAQTWSVMRSLV